MNRNITAITSILVLAFASSEAREILWFSDANRVNLNSEEAPMDASFRFELGVFADGFVPDATNKSQWAEKWRPVQRTSYDAGTARFASQYTVSDNTSPFLAGADAYVWGFSGDAAASEWILFRNGSWDWPVPDPFSPIPLEWNAKDAVEVLGEIHLSGNPFLMKTAAVSNVAPPVTTWEQWREDMLDGETQNGPDDDPDHDGTKNLLEFVFGTNPQSAGPPTATPVDVVDGHLRITIPRRVDHPANLVVEVSEDLQNWQSGAGHTEVVSDTVMALVVRDLTLMSVLHPKRFIRLRVTLP